MTSIVKSAPSGLHCSYIVAPPLLRRRLPAATLPNRSSTDTSRGLRCLLMSLRGQTGSHRISILDTA